MRLRSNEPRAAPFAAIWAQPDKWLASLPPVSPQVQLRVSRPARLCAKQFPFGALMLACAAQRACICSFESTQTGSGVKRSFTIKFPRPSGGTLHILHVRGEPQPSRF